MVETNEIIRYQQIQASLGIGMSQIQKVIHEHLGVIKLCTRWIPHNLIES